MFIMNMLVDNSNQSEETRSVRVPLHVRIVLSALATFFVAGAAFAAIVAMDLLFPGTILAGLWKIKSGSEQQFLAVGWLGPILLLLLSAALLTAGIGLFRRRNWGRWLTVVLLLINLGPDVPDLLHGDWAVAPFAAFVAVLVVYLCLPIVGRALSITKPERKGMMTRLRSERSLWSMVGILSLSLLVISLDITVLNTALPTISTDLKASTSSLQWFVDAYSLAFAGVMLPAGLLGDRFGRKRLLIAGLVVFFGASIWCAISTTAAELIAARATMGAGAAIVLPLTIAIISAISSDVDRPKAIGITTAAVALGLPLGPVIGGLLLTHFSWSSVFWINVPVVPVALIMSAVLLPESRNANGPHIDLLSVLVSVCGIVAVVFGIIRAPESTWSDPVVLSLLIGGLLLIGVFVWRQATTRHPLIDPRLFADSRFTWGTVATVAISVGLFAILFVLPQYFQGVQHVDALTTGLRLIPLMVGLFIAGAGSGLLVKRVGPRATIVCALILLAAGFVILSALMPDSSYWLVLIGLALCGLGIGAGISAAMDGVMAASGGDEAGAGASVNSTLRQVGGALAVATLGSLLNSIYQKALAPSTHELSAAARTAAQGSIQGANTVALALGQSGHTLAAAAQYAFSNGLSAVMGVSVVVSLAAAVLVLLFFPAASTRTSARHDESGLIGEQH
jgi:EmrB/QacA subfamily drug resistance transporter